MTSADKRAFVAAFNRLIAAGLHNTFAKKSDQERAAITVVYFESLSGLSLDAILQAEAFFRCEGTTDGWFPSSPEWYQVAAEYEAALLEQVPVAKQLPPAPEVVAEEIEAIRAARDSFVAQCRAHGADGIANYFASLEIRHPSEDPERVYCHECHDTGAVGVASETGREQPWTAACGCAEQNPLIRSRRLRARTRALVESRRRRAAQLAPARSDLQRIGSGA